MKRTPLRRKKPMRRSALRPSAPMRKKRRSAAEIEADRLAAQIVHARPRCEMGSQPDAYCSGALEQHHARGRLKAYRWRTESHLLLCANHHRWSVYCSAHGAPRAFREWMEKNKPEILALRCEPETAEEAAARLRKEVLP